MIAGSASDWIVAGREELIVDGPVMGWTGCFPARLAFEG